MLHTTYKKLHRYALVRSSWLGMTLIKRLDKFILAKFLQLFVGAFFICLFVFIMQFTWRWINDLVGKGLTLDILAQFFWYVAITLVPTSLPLAVLLASLITFGNMGENLELLSMKAAGVPLRRVMMPIFFLLLPIVGISFHFQNAIAPAAQRSLRTLLYSIKISQPAVEIPEGVFYNGVKGVNLYVERKNVETGMLYNTIIYKTDEGFDKAQIILADSAKLEITADKMHLRLLLWAGVQFQNLSSNGTTGNVSTSLYKPNDKESFVQKVLLISFNSNFNKVNEDEMGTMPQAKDLAEIQHDVDSMNRWIDSTTISNFRNTESRYNLNFSSLSTKDSLRIIKAFAQRPQALSQILAGYNAEKRQQAKEAAAFQLQRLMEEQSWYAELVSDQERYIRRHWIEWHTKLTLSLACLLFFFVGAPLGAIIRKGGLGMPTVISVAIFILYYIINTSSMKTVREGNMNMFLGMWLSSLILAPVGAYLSYMANKDSVVFNLDTYLYFLRRILGFKGKRIFFRKEVIITPPNYAIALQEIDDICLALPQFSPTNALRRPPSYWQLFFAPEHNNDWEQLIKQTENLLQHLANSNSHQLIAQLNQVPVCYAHANRAYFKAAWKNRLCGLLLPLGSLLWVRKWRLRWQLHNDLKLLVQSLTHIKNTILELQLN